jgi:predicted DNA-binding protein (MmcQ/YjbR family)
LLNDYIAGYLYGIKVMEEKKYLKLNDTEAYRIAFHLSNYTWNVVLLWGVFEKDKVGKQFVRAVCISYRASD